MSTPKIVFVLPALGGGGFERVTLNLARGLLARSVEVDLVLAAAEGEMLGQVPRGVNVIDLGTPVRLRLLRGLPALFAYFRKSRADGVIAYWVSLEPLVYAAVKAAYLRRGRPRLVYAIHNTSRWIESLPFHKRIVGWPMTWIALRWADAVVAVSHGVAQEFSRRVGLPSDRFSVIYNPVVTPELFAKAEEPLNHHWFAPGAPPVVLGVGRLHIQKDFPTLIRAFAHLRATRPCRLMILGEGEERARLKALVRELGLEEDVALPGFVDNPYKYMKRAAVFVLSSAWEGLPTVLIEALALGTPVVSTDCPSGPAEILEGGRYGPLVPVGDAAALAKAMAAVLESLPAPEFLRAGAVRFTLDAAVDAYLRVLLPSTRSPRGGVPT